MRHLAFVLLIMIGVPTAAFASTYGVWGVGTSSCGDWTYFHEQSGEKDILHSRVDEIEDAWLGGFISSYDDFGMARPGNVAAATDMNGMVAWVSNYCKAHPLDTVATASGALVEELEARRKRSH